MTNYITCMDLHVVNQHQLLGEPFVALPTREPLAAHVLFLVPLQVVGPCKRLVARLALVALLHHVGALVVLVQFLVRGKVAAARLAPVGFISGVTFLMFPAGVKYTHSKVIQN